MALKYFCQEHGIYFFKKGAMKGYAHPIAGTTPTEWCNMPENQEGVEEEQTAKPPEKPPKEHMVEAAKKIDTDWGKKDSERNRSMCVSYAKDLAVADKIDVSSIVEFAKLYLHYIEKGE